MNKRVVLSAILSLVLCVSLIAGGTFALFTSETKTNVAINAGNVEVEAWIADVKTYTFDVLQPEGTFELGGTAIYDTASNTLNLDKVAPGDRVELNVHIKNNSNIAVKYRVRVAFTGELQSVLVADITLPNEKDATTLTAADAATGWVDFDDTNKSVLPMNIKLPYEVGNDYQNKSASIVITVEAVQANATNLIMIGDTKYDTLEAAIAAVKDGETIGLTGDYDMPAINNINNPNGVKNFTFAAIKDGYASLKMPQVYGQTVAASDCTLTFDGITFMYNDTVNYVGISHAKEITYKNCTIYGMPTNYAPTVTFEGCDFINYASYNLWTYAATKATFTDCNFTTGGKAVLVYTEPKIESELTFNNCVFNDNNTLKEDDGVTDLKKAAVEVGESAKSKDSVYTINLNKCVANGFSENKSNSPLWGNKSSLDKDHLKVFIDGQSVNTLVNTYTITTAAELKEVLTLAGTAGANNSVIELTADVKLTEAWTPITISGYQGAGVVTINGNKHTISGLTAPLFAGGFAGQSGIVIKDLTIADSKIVSTNTLGSGAFIETVDSMKVITLSNCHLKNSTVTGSRTGGLIGWNSGYNNTNDGAVETIVTVENCTVEKCTITGEGTVGGIIGHAGANAWTWNNITNCKVIDCDLVSNDEDYRVGGIIGTANVGSVTITNCTVDADTTMLQNNNGTEIARPANQSNLYGRAVLNSTGSLIIDGQKIGQ